jgi:hypothetical protein
VHAANKRWPGAAHGPTHSTLAPHWQLEWICGFADPPTTRSLPQRDRSAKRDLSSEMLGSNTLPAHEGRTHLGAAAATAVHDAVRGSAALRALVAPFHRAALAAAVRLAEAESVHRCFGAALLLASAIRASPHPPAGEQAHPPRAKQVNQAAHTSKCVPTVDLSYRVPPPCILQYGCPPFLLAAALLHPSFSQRLPPPCALHSVVLPCALFVHPSYVQRLPPP